ncbi:radical SAM family heme chaperone HemW [Haliovirga abyssi]|uniref:Heme chaperone HemW n=1 Tax=Haliovirga abyssi TaxID=2996794 RepID=A0AAU9DJU2_9FUSO|nr:radical SAM family heme chaperone HemW [Haliovirga abyssi]BDU51149.1 coproporphyrinogen III oxidase [Haliovirga abyssi]
MIDAIYIHIPFCVKKCNYCDFVSFSNNKNRDLYIKYLIKELKLYSNYVYDTVYIGGGTPSLLKIEEVKEILNSINIAKNAEITFEINPKTVDYEKLKELKNLGINRVSIGCQSFNNETLKILGRIHNSEIAIKTYKDARKAGFDNINLDLMFAVPGQTLKTLKKDLNVLEELSPQHISIYSLILEENTKFWEMKKSGELNLVGEDLEAEMYKYIIEYLENIGYNQYEISNFSKTNYESKHNLKYWRNQHYVGAGLGASGYIQNKRYKNEITFEKYFEKIDNKKFPIKEVEKLNDRHIEEYKYILGLRLVREGVEILNSEYVEIAEKLIKRHLLNRIKNRYFLTKKGLFLANDVFVEFIK